MVAHYTVSVTDTVAPTTAAPVAHFASALHLAAFDAASTSSNLLVTTGDLAITLSGVNDAPVIDPVAPQKLMEMPNTTGSSVPDTVTVHTTFTDPDLSDTGHTASVTGVVATGATTGLVLDSAQLLALLQPGMVAKAAGSSAGSADFVFSASDGAFDFLADGRTLNLNYTVAVDDHHGGVGTQNIPIEIMGADDAPQIVSGGGGDTATYVVHKHSLDVATIQATDPDQDAKIAYSIVGGADDSLFQIDAATGALAFKPSAHFGDNKTFDVKVAASDGTLSDIQDITVRVADNGGMHDGHERGDTLVFRPNFGNDEPPTPHSAPAPFDDLAVDQVLNGEAGGRASQGVQVLSGGISAAPGGDAGSPPHPDHDPHMQQEDAVLHSVFAASIHSKDLPFG
jgi:VCBS repeat-containing protein